MRHHGPWNGACEVGGAAGDQTGGGAGLEGVAGELQGAGCVAGVRVG